MKSLRAAALSGWEQLAHGPHPERARQDAAALLRHALDKDQAWVMAHAEEALPTHVEEHFNILLKRRFTGEPMQYILGEAEFYGLALRVTPDVLIPRPETEHLLEAVLEQLKHNANLWTAPRIADVGTGSGAIAIALASQLPTAQITAIDLSSAALEIAQENAERHAAKIRFVTSDLLTQVADEQFEIIAANPPYIPVSDRSTLAVEVREHEPALALFAGTDGLDLYRKLIPSAYATLVPGGWLILEIGFGQTSVVRTLMTESGFDAIHFIADLQGISRVVCGQKQMQSDK